MPNPTEVLLRIQMTLPPVPGGMEQHVRRLTDEQRKLGYRVILLFADGDVVHPDDLRVGRDGGLARIRPQSLRDLLFLVTCFPILWRHRGRVDLVHVHGDWSMALVGWLAMKILFARKLMLSVHDGPLPSSVREWLRSHIFPLADLIHATGRRDARRIEGQLRKRVLWQSSGIGDLFLEPSGREMPRTLPYKQGLLVISTAILRPKKNIDLVLDVAKRMPEATFLVLGDGSERVRLSARAIEEGVDNVSFLGRQSQVEVKAWLDRAHLFLCTSFVEGTPTAVLEAMARGLPIITSNCAEFSGIVDQGETGYVIEGFNPEEYVAALRISAVPEAWFRMSCECGRRAGMNAWPQVAARITQEMRKCLIAQEAI